MSGLAPRVADSIGLSRVSRLESERYVSQSEWKVSQSE